MTVGAADGRLLRCSLTEALQSGSWACCRLWELRSCCSSDHIGFAPQTAPSDHLASHDCWRGVRCCCNRNIQVTRLAAAVPGRCAVIWPWCWACQMWSAAWSLPDVSFLVSASAAARTYMPSCSPWRMPLSCTVAGVALRWPTGRLCPCESACLLLQCANSGFSCEGPEGAVEHCTRECAVLCPIVPRRTHSTRLQCPATSNRAPQRRRPPAHSLLPRLPFVAQDCLPWVQQTAWASCCPPSVLLLAAVIPWRKVKRGGGCGAHVPSGTGQFAGLRAQSPRRLL
jgi:hypothetical protein